LTAPSERRGRVPTGRTGRRFVRERGSTPGWGVEQVGLPKGGCPPNQARDPAAPWWEGCRIRRDAGTRLLPGERGAESPPGRGSDRRPADGRGASGQAREQGVGGPIAGVEATMCASFPDCAPGASRGRSLLGPEPDQAPGLTPGEACRHPRGRSLLEPEPNQAPGMDPEGAYTWGGEAGHTGEPRTESGPRGRLPLLRIPTDPGLGRFS
jgi:hypothetical protein